MRKLGKLKYATIFAVIWLACLVFVLATSTLPTKYADTEAGVNNLYALYECQGVMEMPSGYQCDWYEPHVIVYLAIILGTVAFILTIASFVMARKLRA